MKKYQEPIKRSIRMLHRKQSKNLVGMGAAEEWSCQHCDLTFENPIVLNLHTLTHAAEDAGFGTDGTPMDGTAETDSGQCFD